jgi:hypothetical protein
MKMKTRTDSISRAFRNGFVLSLLVSLFGPLLHAQEIHIRVLNARNGRPITDECVNVWIGTFYGPHMVAATNRDGVVVLHPADNEFVAEAACLGWPARASRPAGLDTITVAADKYVACQEYGKVLPGDAAHPNLLKEVMPSYPIKKILESGVAAGNTCGKFRAEAKPGELILFVRPRSFLERARE